MKIDHICTVKMGRVFRTGITHEPNGNVSVVQPRNITNEGILVKTDIYRVKMLSIKPVHLLMNGDVLLASRGRFAAAVYKGERDANFIASSSILILTIKKKEILPEYIALYFNSKLGKRELKRFNETTTIPFISRAKLKQMDIPVPPLEKQNALIAIERSKQRYAQLTNRKVVLLNSIINHKLTNDLKETQP